MSTDPQRVLDIMMQCLLLVHDAHKGGEDRGNVSMRSWVDNASQDDIAMWACSQLSQCGIKTEPRGCSYAVIVNDERND